jgi:very-short-patch-repair endonuclease
MKAKHKWKYDKRITQKLRYKGYKVMRFWERDIYKNISKIGNKIIKKMIK